MSYFKNSEEMYKIYKELFDHIASHPQIGSALANSGLIVCFKVSDPEGKFTVNCRDKPIEKEKYISYEMGESVLKPDLSFTCSSDFCHEFWQGKVNIVSAILSGDAKVEGKIQQAMKLLPALKPVYNLYPQILKEIGREDLIIK
ncbi:MAG: SCP2 sterol-binding domain-containing protein [Candidatus Aminicenantaceae bacterium]